MYENEDIDIYEVVVHPDPNEDADKLANKITDKVCKYIIGIEKDMDNETVLTIQFSVKENCEAVIEDILDAGIKRDMYIHMFNSGCDNKWKK